MGTTTIGCSYILWSALFHNFNYNIISAQKLSMAMDDIFKIYVMYGLLPDEFKYMCPIKNKNKTTIEFNNGSKIFASQLDSNHFKGMTINNIFDQWMFIPEQDREEFKQAYYPVISSNPNSKIIAVTTGNRIHSRL